MLHERKLSELSGITDQMFTTTFECEHALKRLTSTALVVAFHGDYRPGSRGNPDARFMAATVRAGVVAWSPTILVIDLRGLRYDGGDMIGLAWEQEPNLPAAIAVSDRCRAAMTSFVTEEMGADPAAWLFATPEEALTAAIGRFARKHGA